MVLMLVMAEYLVMCQEFKHDSYVLQHVA